MTISLRLLLSGLLLCALSVQAQPVDVVTEYLNPYQVKRPDGSLGGYSTEVVEALFERTKDSPRIRVMPWARTYRRALMIPDTLIYSLAYNDIRKPKFHCVGVLDVERLFFWGLKDSSVNPVSSLDELRQYVIAVTQSANPEQYLTQQGFERLVRVVKPNQSLGMLFKGRVDVIISARKPLIVNTKKLNYSPDKLQSLFEFKALNHPLCVAFNRQSSDELVQKYRDAFQSLKQDGTLAAIRQRWGFEPLP